MLIPCKFCGISHLRGENGCPGYPNHGQRPETVSRLAYLNLAASAERVGSYALAGFYRERAEAVAR